MPRKSPALTGLFCASRLSALRPRKRQELNAGEDFKGVESCGFRPIPVSHQVISWVKSAATGVIQVCRAIDYSEDRAFAHIIGPAAELT
jgi:hypothetical protein